MTDGWRWNCKVHESSAEVIAKHPVFINEDKRINLWLAVCQEFINGCTPLKPTLAYN